MSAETLRAKIREIPDFPKPGILFYDITTLLKDPAAYKEAIDLMLEPYRGEQIDIVVGMESRGFIFSAPMAYLLDTGLVPVRKLGKLPAETLTVEYALEYGSNTLEIHRDAIQPGQKVLIVDDLLATGGTVRGHDRARRAAQGRGRRPGVPRRARVPQGPRAARRPPGHQRHPVLTAGGRADGAPGRDDRRHDRPTRPAAQDPGPATVLPPVRGRRDVLGRVGHRRGAAPPAGVRRGGARAARRSRGGRRRRCRARGRRPPRSSGPPEDERRAPGSAPRCAGTATCAGSSTSGGCRTSWWTSRSAAAATAWPAIRDEAIVGAPAQAQLGAVTLALAAGELRTSPPVRAAGDDPRRRQRAAERAARVRGRCSRPWHRMLARRGRLGIEADGEARRRRAARRGRGDHRGGVRGPRRAGHVAIGLLDGLPRRRRGAAARADASAAPGAMGGGQFGTALSAIIAAHHAGRAGPRARRRDAAGLRGRRGSPPGSSHEAGVPHAVVTDAAAPGPDRGGRGRRGAGRRRPGRGERRRRRDRRHVPAGARRVGGRDPVHRLRRLDRPRRRPGRRRLRRARGRPARAGRSPPPARAWRPRERRIRNPRPGPDAGRPRHGDRDRARCAAAAVRGRRSPPCSRCRRRPTLPEAAAAPSTPVPPADSAPSTAEAVG